MSWKKFLEKTPMNSIALDGIVTGGPAYDESTRHVNFDHHDKIVREATMSTCMQVYFAINGGLFKLFRENGKPYAHVYINDVDQDVALSMWELENYRLIERTDKIENLKKFIELTNELDVTGGSFPQNFNDKLIHQHNWVFEEYNKLRKSGKLADASEEIVRKNLESTNLRITAFVMGRSGEKEMEIKYEILYQSPYGYSIINEIGGNESRPFLFLWGMDAFISLVGERDDGKKVWSIGRRSRYIPFPVNELYNLFNKAENLSEEDGWNGSDNIGGSSRIHGSKLDYKQLSEITDNYLSEKYKNLYKKSKSNKDGV